MRPWIATGVLGALLCLVSGVAGAQVVRHPEGHPEYAAVNAHPAECARLRRQIDHFEGMQQRAEQLGNEMWAARLDDHLELLGGMQAARCPADVPVDEAAEAFKQFLLLAGRAALTYFTFGAAGF